MPVEESFHEFIRTWTTDAQGRRIMRGLTVEETAYYQEYQAKRRAQHENQNKFPWGSVAEMREARARWLELHDKHDAARIAAIAAEIELREDRPPIN